MSRIIYKKIEEKESIYRIQATIRKTSISMVILEETNKEFNAYDTSVILEQNLKKQADQLGISLDKYYDKLIFFLENPQKVKFTFNKNSLLILETVKSNLQVKYFQCDLRKVENFSSFIGILIDEIQEQTLKSQEKHFEMTEKYNLLEKEVVEYKIKLKELIERKNEDEQVMLSNFVLLLNEKKRRIQHLNELLETFRSNPTLANPAEVNISNYQKKRKIIQLKTEQPSTSRVKEEVSDSSQSSNYDHDTTDSERNEETVEMKSEVSVASECINDIFDESPKTFPTLPSISREHTTSRIVTTMPIDSCSENEKGESMGSVNLDMLVHESKCFNTPVVEISTQDWLDRL